MQPADAPVHGTRATYQAGCTCLPCRAANAHYVKTYIPANWTTADASKARLKAIAQQGVGLRRAHELTGLSVAHLQRIRNGQQRTVKLTTEATILGMKASLAHGQRINAYRTKHLIRSLLGEDYTSADLARRLGLRSERLQFHHASITVRNALKVRSLWRNLMAE